jgi:hypothetical protein
MKWLFQEHHLGFPMLNRGSITTNIVALVSSKEPVFSVGVAAPPVGLDYRLRGRGAPSSPVAVTAAWS